MLVFSRQISAIVQNQNRIVNKLNLTQAGNASAMHVQTLNSFQDAATQLYRVFFYIPSTIAYARFYLQLYRLQKGTRVKEINQARKQFSCVHLY